MTVATKIIKWFEVNKNCERLALEICRFSAVLYMKYKAKFGI